MLQPIRTLTSTSEAVWNADLALNPKDTFAYCIFLLNQYYHEAPRIPFLEFVSAEGVKAGVPVEVMSEYFHAFLRF